MAPKTRLDPLVKWKERELDAARRLLAERMQALASARARAEAAASELTKLPTQAKTIDDFALFEGAAAHARKQVALATAEAEVAGKAVKVAQDAVTEVNRRVEMFRRANERQRAALVQEAERAERKTLDELALLLRKPS